MVRNVGFGLMNRVGRVVREIQLGREQLVAAEMHLHMHMDCPQRVPPGINGQELDLALIVGRLRPAQESLRAGWVPVAAAPAASAEPGRLVGINIGMAAVVPVSIHAPRAEGDATTVTHWKIRSKSSVSANLPSRCHGLEVHSLRDPIVP